MVIHCLQVSWMVDGNTFSGATDAATSSTVAGASTSAGENWMCSVTASDGTASSASASSSVSINSAVTESCLDVLNNGNTSDGVYTLTLSDGSSFDVYCDLTTDGGGWTLYAITDSDECAENLTFGSDELLSLSDNPYLSILMRDAQHSEFMQDFRADGSNTSFIILWSFSNSKTLQSRFADAQSSGESVSWDVLYSGNTYNLNGTWRFSNSSIPEAT